MFRPTRRSFILLSSFCAFSFLVLLSYRPVSRLVSSHSFDLSYSSLFDAQFRVYVLTHDCGRFTPTIASTFETVVIVPDVVNGSDCAALNRTLLHLDLQPDEWTDKAYKEKYVKVLEDCEDGGSTENDGGKMKCLILEDDIIFLHEPKRTREVLVENTLSLFNNEESAYDCTKRGFGWFSSTQTGQGSQCRIFSRTSVSCLSQCITNGDQEQLDYAIKECQSQCGLVQRRFLLAVHGGLTSTMNRDPT